MKDIALFVGNSINSLSSGLSWKQVLANIIAYCDCSDLTRLSLKISFSLLFAIPTANPKFFAEEIQNVTDFHGDIIGLMIARQPRSLLEFSYKD